MNCAHFGTDGVRGRVGVHPITPDFVKKLGRAAAKILTTETDPRPIIAIGRDTRGSGAALEAALAEGINSAGCDVILLGILPTPGVASFVADNKLAAGAVISASHNPACDNGVKFFSGTGHKLSNETEWKIEREMDVVTPDVETRGVVKTAGNKAADDYVSRSLRSLPEGFRLHGLKIAVDCANGASFETTPDALRRLGAEVLVFHATPDGSNINLRCGSTEPGEIGRLVRESGAHVGIAHDGDADRVLLCDETGETLDGDELLAMAALDLLHHGKLTHNTLVATVMSNLGLDEAIVAAGGRVIRTAVGDRCVTEAMRSGGFSLGGEQSGHIIFARHGLCGDGLVAALQILRLMAESGKPLSLLRKALRKYPQAQRHIAVRTKPPLETLPEIREAIRAAEAALVPNGRVFVRYSNTESTLRILLEGRNAILLEQHADAIAARAQASIGV